MNRMLKTILISSLILIGHNILASTSPDCCEPCCETCCETCCCCDCYECECICGCGNPCMATRSQSWNTARDLVGWQQFINRVDMDKFYGAFYITPEYTRSFKPARLAGHLFGKDYEGGSLTISGSQVANRGKRDWMADYFGLPADFKSTVQFCPRVSNFLVDFGLYFGLDNWKEGAYLKIHAPVVHTKHEFAVCEEIIEAGTAFAAGYMSEKEIPRDDLAEGFKDALITGCYTWGDMTEVLEWSKIDPSCCERTETKLSDIQVALGRNFRREEDGHAGIHILVGFPTGNKRCCEYMFAPVVGNGGHFELGGGFTSSRRLWISDDEERSCWMYLDANFAHLFKRELYRTFELKGKPNSRYMLVMEMKTPSENLYVDPPGPDNIVASTYQYNGKLLPLANVTTCCTKVDIALQTDITLKFAWNRNNWSLDLGYNFWGRTGEKVCNPCQIEKNKYALKGDALLYAWSEEDPYPITALGGTQSDADIHFGTNKSPNTPWRSTDPNNLGVDSSWPSAYDNTPNFLTYPKGSARTSQNLVYSSYQPKFLSSEDLDVCKKIGALSHKIFGHIGYAWNKDSEDMEAEPKNWTPYLGLGGEVEFSGKVKGQYSALYQWGIWLKGGASFD